MVPFVSTAEGPSVRTRGYRKKERTRRELLAAAIEVIAAKGETFSIIDVVREAGVSNGTFYNYFDDRDALLDAVNSEVLGTFTAGGAEAIDEADPARRFAVISALLLQHAVALPKLAEVLVRLESMAGAELAVGDPLVHLRHDLAEGATSGRFTCGPTPAIVDLVSGTLLRAVGRIAAADEATDADYHRDVIASILRALGVQADEAATLATEAVKAAELAAATGAEDWDQTSPIKRSRT